MTESRQYALGRFGRIPTQMQRDAWTQDENRDYERGLRDRRKMKRKAARKRRAANVVEIPAIILAVLGIIAGWALVSALPIIIILVFIKLLFLGGF
jgi:fatty acid desaturase